jgi:hypothetical protein
MPPPEYRALDASSPSFLIKYDFTDYPFEQRVEVSFSNKLGYAVCLSADQWPKRGGVMDQSSEGMTLVVAQQRFSVNQMATELCPGCVHYVAPGEMLRASIPYDAFHLPEALFNEKKQLEFFPRAFRCEKRK